MAGKITLNKLFVTQTNFNVPTEYDKAIIKDVIKQQNYSYTEDKIEKVFLDHTKKFNKLNTVINSELFKIFDNKFLEEFETNLQEIRTNHISSKRTFTQNRKIYQYCINNIFTKLSYYDIWLMTTGQDHATVIHGIKLCNDLWDVKDKQIEKAKKLIEYVKNKKHEFKDISSSKVLQKIAINNTSDFDEKIKNNLVTLLSSEDTKQRMEKILNCEQPNNKSHQINMLVKKILTTIKHIK